MASLNLVPNPSVMIVQTGIFLANFVIIKKLFLEPYLKVSDKRAAVTTGGVKDADSIVKSNLESQARIDSKMSDVRDEAAKLRQLAQSEAQKEATSIVSAAEVDARLTVSAVREEIQQNSAEERQKIPAIVEELTGTVFQKVLGV